jgi:hypothetical protein
MEKIERFAHPISRELIKQFDLKNAYITDRKMFRYLMSKGCEYRHLLKIAVAFNDIYLVKKILNEKVSIATSIHDLWGDAGSDLLKLACQKGHATLLEYLLEIHALYGATVSRDVFYWGIPSLKIVKLLLTHGQNLEHTCESFTRLVSSPKTLRYLIHLGHISPVAVDTKGVSLLKHASNTCYESFRFLLDTDTYTSAIFVLKRPSIQNKIINRYLFKRFIAKYELTYFAKVILCDKMNVPYADIRKPAHRSR